MNKSVKTIPQKGVLFNLQYDMCNLVYRKLNELMLSIGENEIDIKFVDIKIRLYINNSGQENIFYFYTLRDGKISVNLGELNLKKISLQEINDPIIALCKKYKNDNTDIPTLYSNWFDELKKSMQSLLEKENKYNQMIDDIKSLPIFSPTREVLFEKKY